MEMRSCGDFPILTAYFDTDSDRSTVERSELLLLDETLVAIVEASKTGEHVWVVQPGGKVIRYDSIEAANQAGSPCIAAKRLLDSRLNTYL